jgi:hypothetical protein
MYGHSTDDSYACPECGVVPSRLVDGDHAEGCSREEPPCAGCGWRHGWHKPGCPEGGKYVPQSFYALMAHLHLTDAPRERQETAIREWLRDHPAGPAMTYTLESEGFGHLLHE